LAVLLSTQAVQSAPAGLAASAIAAAGAAGTILPATSTLQIIMASTKAKIGLAALLAAGVTTPLVLQYQANSRLTNQLALLRQKGPELDRLREEVERLKAEARSSSEQRERERTELARLRGELTALKARDTKNPSSAQVAPPTKSQAQDAPKASPGTLVP